MASNNPIPTLMTFFVSNAAHPPCISVVSDQKVSTGRDPLRSGKLIIRRTPSLDEIGAFRKSAVSPCIFKVHMNTRSATQPDAFSHVETQAHTGKVTGVTDEDWKMQARLDLFRGD
jgi:hypothetical protein